MSLKSMYVIYNLYCLCCCRLEPLLYEIQKDNTTLAASFLDWMTYDSKGVWDLLIIDFVFPIVIVSAHLIGTFNFFFLLNTFG